MGRARRITESRALRALLYRTAAYYIRLVHKTGRWRVLGAEHTEPYLREGKPFIVAFWHNRLLMAPVGWRRDLPVKVMVSRHRDGEMIAETVRHFGIETIRGSSSRGGSAALRMLVRELRAGSYVGITPDGPRGPRMRVQPGIIALARLSGAPILPATYATSRRRLANSWDRFVIALPFSRGVYLWDEPICVAPDADEAAQEEARHTLEERLIALTAQADRMVGVEPIEPDPAPAEARADAARAAAS